MKLSEETAIISLIKKMKLSLVSERYDPANFGNALIELADGHGLKIRITKDRSQYFIDLAINSDEWFGLYQLEGFLHPDSSIMLADSPIDRLCDLLKKNIVSYHAAFQGNYKELQQYIVDEKTKTLQRYKKSDKLS